MEQRSRSDKEIVYVERKKPFYKRVWFIILAIIVVIVAISASAGSNKEEATKVSTGDSKTSTSEVQDQTIKIGDTFTFGDFTFKTSDLREVTPEYGNETYTVFTMEITANADNQMFSGTIQGVTASNTVVNNEIVIMSDSSLGDPIATAWSKKLSKGQKAIGYVAFKKSDNVTKAELTSYAFSDKKTTIELN